MANIYIVSFISVMLFLGIPVIIFFAIRYLIKYNAQLKNKKSSGQQEMDKMKIDDLA